MPFAGALRTYSGREERMDRLQKLSKNNVGTDAKE